MKAAAYSEAVRWLALNDDPDNLVASEIAGNVTTLLVADLYRKAPLTVARAVVKARKDALAQVARPWVQS